MEQFKSVPEVLKWIEDHYDNPTALNYHKDGKWHSISTKQMLDEVRWLALALRKLGVQKGDRIGILAQPSPNWTIVKLAIMMSGGVLTPTFANLSSEHFVFEVTQANIKTIFVAGEEQWARLREHRDLFQLSLAVEGFGGDESSLSYEEALLLGQEMEKENPSLWNEMIGSINSNDTAALVYTSGSTGRPKAAVLTHFNLVGSLHVQPFDLCGESDVFLSILPLAHIFGLAMNFIMLAWDINIYYFNDLKKIAVIAQELHPTVLILVPRLLEKMYAKMVARVQEAGYLKRTIGEWAFGLANNENDDGLYKQICHPLADKLVYGTIRETLGGKLRLIVSGGAPLKPRLCHFFIDIGFPVYEGWGMTEGCPLAVNRFGKRKIGTVGIPYDLHEIKVSQEGELLAKGPNVMQGYYLNPEANATVFDEEGWLRTGDKGIVDEEGFVRIIGRIKELFKTSTGKYVAPVPIEHEICSAPLIDMAMVIAEGRKFSSVLIYPDFEVLQLLKKVNKVQNQSDEEFLESDFIRNEMEKLISQVNQHLDSWEKIHAYRFIPNPPTIESGELTPSMKLRREAVANKYSHLIDAMYAEE